jgi:endoplasmic reticulum chaperone BiP
MGTCSRCRRSFVGSQARGPTSASYRPCKPLHQLGGKIDEDDKDTLLEAVKEATDWLEENAATTTTEDYKEQKDKLSNVAYPITSKLYAGCDMPDADGDDIPFDHDEL